MGKPSGAADSGDEDLHAAARSGDLKAVVEICAANPLAVNSRDKHSRTPLHLAAWSGHAEVVNYLHKNKADLGAAAMDDMGAIHFAAQKGHLEVVKILVASGVSVKSSNRKGMTALHYAAQGSNVELVKYLLKKGASKDLENKAGKSAVDLASNEEISKALLEHESSSASKVVVKGSEKGEKVETEVSSGGEAEGSKSNAVEGEEGEIIKIKSENEMNEDEPEEGEILKRKSESEINEGTKKPKVALSHLLADDDTLEDEENE